MNSYEFKLSGSVGIDIAESAKVDKPIKIIANDREHLVEITSMSRQVGSFAPVVGLGNMLVREPRGYEISVIGVEVEESAFENPRWVTFDAHTDTYDMLADELTHNKDYKVFGTTDTAYIIITDAGEERFIGKEFFYPVTKEDLLPSKKPNIVDDDSFEGLVYKQPKQDSYIVVNTLTEEQQQYLGNIMCEDIDCPCKYDKSTKFYIYAEHCWLKARAYRPDKYKQIFFNDIFIKEE